MNQDPALARHSQLSDVNGVRPVLNLPSHFALVILVRFRISLKSHGANYRAPSQETLPWKKGCNAARKWKLTIFDTIKSPPKTFIVGRASRYPGHDI